MAKNKKPARELVIFFEGPIVQRKESHQPAV
jgi:hypothetical protein